MFSNNIHDHFIWNSICCWTNSFHGCVEHQTKSESGFRSWVFQVRWISKAHDRMPPIFSTCSSSNNGWKCIVDSSMKGFLHCKLQTQWSHDHFQGRFSQICISNSRFCRLLGFTVTDDLLTLNQFHHHQLSRCLTRWCILKVLLSCQSSRSQIFHPCGMDSSRYFSRVSLKESPDPTVLASYFAHWSMVFTRGLT